MGKHRGWRVEPRANGKYRGQYRTRAKVYISKTFRSSVEATTWAKRMAAGIELKLSWAGAQAGGARTEQLAADYLADLDRRRRSARHIRDAKLFYDRLAVSAPDLAVGAAAKQIADHLDDIQRLDKKKAPLAPTTRNRHIVHVRALCRWALAHERIERDPSQTLRALSVPSYLRPQFSVEELRTCLAHDRYDSGRGGVRKPDPWHRLFAILCYSGLRFEEGAYLRWQDIDWSGGVILVRMASGAAIKREKERIVPLQNELRAILEPAKQTAGPIIAREMLFNPVRSFRNFLKRAKVDIDGRSPHSLRHTWVGMMTATGVPSLLLSAYLGHSSAQTTMGYGKASARYVTAVADWPRGELRIMIRARPVDGHRVRARKASPPTALVG